MKKVMRHHRHGKENNNKQLQLQLLPFKKEIKNSIINYCLNAYIEKHIQNATKEFNPTTIRGKEQKA